MTAEFSLDGLPPTINNYYGYRNSGVYKKEAAREWQEAACEQLRSEWGNQPKLTGALELRIEFQTSSRRKWDMDNRLKSLQDCMEVSGIIENDNQIERLYVERKRGAKDWTHIKLTEIRNAETEGI